MSDKKVNYILNTVGITLPGYARKDLKSGMSVVLTESVGDGFEKRGFLTKASEALSKDDKVLIALKEENAKLKAEIAKLKAK
jgi:hypothetical protein